MVNRFVTFFLQANVLVAAGGDPGPGQATPGQARPPQPGPVALAGHDVRARLVPQARSGQASPGQARLVPPLLLGCLLGSGRAFHLGGLSLFKTGPANFSSPTFIS